MIPVEDVPLDVWQHVSSFLSLEDCFSLIQSCSFIRSLGELKVFWIEGLKNYRLLHPVPFSVTLDLTLYSLRQLKLSARRVRQVYRTWTSPSLQVTGSSEAIPFPPTIALSPYERLTYESPDVYDIFLIPGTPLILAVTNSKTVCYRVDQRSMKEMASIDQDLDECFQIELDALGCIAFATYHTDNTCCGAEIRITFDASFDNVTMEVSHEVHLASTPASVALHPEVVAWSCRDLLNDRFFIVAEHRKTRVSSTTNTNLSLPEVDEFATVFRGDLLYVLTMEDTLGFQISPLVITCIPAHHFPFDRNTNLEAESHANCLPHMLVHPWSDILPSPQLDAELPHVFSMSASSRTGVVNVTCSLERPSLMGGSIVRRSVTSFWQLPLEYPKEALKPVVPPFVPDSIDCRAITPSLSIVGRDNGFDWLTSFSLVRGFGSGSNDAKIALSPIQKIAVTHEQVLSAMNIDLERAVHIDEALGIVWIVTLDGRSKEQLHRLRLGPTRK